MNQIETARFGVVYERLDIVYVSSRLFRTMYNMVVDPEKAVDSMITFLSGQFGRKSRLNWMLLFLVFVEFLFYVNHNRGEFTIIFNYI